MNSKLTDSPVQILEARAQQLMQAIAKHEQASLDRIRNRISRLAGATFSDITYDDARLQVARDCGFKSWQMATDLFEARLKPGDDYGDFWYEVRMDILLNLWCANYDEARQVNANEGGYLLPYRRQFVIVQAYFIKIILRVRIFSLVTSR